MSRITFLDNASEGENNLFRYIVTIILTWGTPIVLEIGFIVFISIFYLIISGNDFINQIEAVFSDPIWGIAVDGIFSVISLLFLYIGVRFIHERRFISLVNTVSKVSWKRILKGAGIWFVLLALGTLVSLIIDPGSVKISFNPNTFFLLLILSLVVFPIQASTEELFFRGYLMQGFGLLSKKPVIPLLATSVIFAALHYWNGADSTMSLDIVLQVFIMGLTLGIITLGENRLETAMGVHIINNIFISVLVNNPDAYSQGLPSILTSTVPPNPLVDVPIFALYALALVTIVFWNKKDMLLNIFRDTVNVEVDKVKIKEI